MNPTLEQKTDQTDENLAQNPGKADRRSYYLCARCKTVALGVKVKRDHRLKLDVFRHSVSVERLKAKGFISKKEYSIRNLEYGDVVCGVCGATRTWSASEAALNDLISRLQERKFGIDDDKKLNG